MDRSTKQPLEFATVQLLRIPDSSIIASAVTGRKGKFAWEKIPAGNYLLRSSFVSYKRSIIPVSFKGDQLKHSSVNVELDLLSADLSRVTITSRKSLLNTGIDRKVYNVSEDIMAQTGSASDILKNIPSVEVDIEGQVSLRGSSDVMILINGRPSPLMGKTRAEVLQQLPANSIERIEVITNPSAKYKPDGTAGIINIVLKKNVKNGFNGNLIGSVGNKDRYNGSLGLNYKPGKLNLFGNYSLRKDHRIRLGNIDRVYFDSTEKISEYYVENSNSSAHPLSQIVTLGLDYTADEHNSLGISGNYVGRNHVKHDVVKKWYYDKSKALTLNYYRLRYDPETQKEKDFTAYWQHNFPKEDEELRVEGNFSSEKEQENNHYTNIYHFPAAPPAFDNTIIRQDDRQQQLSVDYANPLTENTKFETGYAGSFNQLDQDFYGEYYDEAQARFVKDIQKSNRFLYKEYIHAVYGTFERSYEKFSYKAGLRAEEVKIKGNLVDKDSLFNNNYFKIFPTLHLSYKGKNGEFQLNYSRRINRPDPDELNPFPEYRDPRNLQAGNPHLRPEIIHSSEFGYKWQHTHITIVSTLYYRYKQNGFTTVIVPLNDSTLLTTMQNLSNDQSTGLELILSVKAVNFFTVNVSSNIFYNQIDASDLGYDKKKSIVSMNTTMNATFTFTKNLMMQVSSNYRSARLTPQGQVYPAFVLNAGVRQDLFRKKLSLTLTASDLLQTLRQKSQLNTTFLKQTVMGRRDGQIFYLGCSYRFGKISKKSTEEKIQFDDSL